MKFGQLIHQGKHFSSKIMEKMRQICYSYVKPKVRLSKTVGEIFEIFCVHLRFRFVFSKVYITFSTKNMDYLTLKCHNFFQN